MPNPWNRPSRPRRGVTLVEMLVVVALVVLMMVILVQIFQVALGAMSASRTTQELDVVLRSVDSIVRSDLVGVTAKLTPPNNPQLKQGYFEYGENGAADLQGEDTDDYLAFTTRAPEGQVFSGRQYLSQIDPLTGRNKDNQTIQPATITSQVAEVIYFLRNGNLYRRVFLVAPERKSSIVSSGPSVGPSGGFYTAIFGSPIHVSFQGMNDISCRPGGYFGLGNPQPPIPNDLGDLTNRENRAFRPRFLNDFTSPGGNGADGIADDSNGDSIPDYYPTLYFDGQGYNPPINAGNEGWAPNRKVKENPALFYDQKRGYLQRIAQYPKAKNSYDVYAFPFIYPGMYSVPDPNRVKNNLGWVHNLPQNPTTLYANQSPLDLGETPGFELPPTGGNQTWWGFPTWRETMSGPNTPTSIPGSPGGTGWSDPVNYVTVNGQLQPPGLRPFDPTVTPPFNSQTFLPPVTNYGNGTTPYGYDGAGSPVTSSNFIAVNPNTANANALWDDELILTNVRSFDVKAYDPDAPLYNTAVLPNTYLSVGYWDLGYAGLSSTTYTPNYAPASLINGLTNNQYYPFQPPNSEPKGFGHEGRIPPVPADFRLDPRRPFAYDDATGNYGPNNIGEDRIGTIRLTHTFDTWSTDYTNAPDSDILLWRASASTQCVYPAFPAPYPSPLRGIQIQIRVTDPRGERTKVLTIRHDFSDKL